jgi:hypothetical protein
MQIISRKKSHGGVDKKPQNRCQPAHSWARGETSIGLASRKDDAASSVGQQA